MILMGSNQSDDFDINLSAGYSIELAGNGGGDFYQLSGQGEVTILDFDFVNDAIEGYSLEQFTNAMDAEGKEFYQHDSGGLHISLYGDEDERMPSPSDGGGSETTENTEFFLTMDAAGEGRASFGNVDVRKSYVDGQLQDNNVEISIDIVELPEVTPANTSAIMITILDDENNNGVYDAGERQIIAEADLIYEASADSVTITAPDVLMVDLYTSEASPGSPTTELEIRNGDLDVLTLVDGVNEMPDSLNIKLDTLIGEMNDNNLSNSLIGSEADYLVTVSGLPLRNNDEYGSDIHEIYGTISIVDDEIIDPNTSIL
jgi:hypothetical protein